MWMKSLPLTQPPNVKAQHGVLGGLDDSGSRRDGMAADVALNSICRPSGTRDSNLRVNPAFRVGLSFRRFRRCPMLQRFSCGTPRSRSRASARQSPRGSN